MEWTEETISHLRSLWDLGLSTAEIGRRMSITKNAVVGKAHRLVLPARPSPIRKSVDGQPSAAKRDAARTTRRASPEHANPERANPDHANAERAGSDRSGRVTVFPKPAGASVPAAPVATGASVAASVPLRPGSSPVQAQATVTPIRPLQAAPPPIRDPDPSSRPISSVEPRRRGLTCCWPIGEPGTKQFHFCGGDPLQGKPYCSEHSQLAYVKLRDRRDTVA